MAEDTVDEAEKILGGSRRCRTRTLQLHGARSRPGGSDRRAMHLHSRYGTDAAQLLALIEENPALGSELVPGLPYLAAEAVWAATAEMAVTLDDILTRRTRARLFDRRASRNAARSVAALVAPALGWDEAECERQVAMFTDECAREDAAALVTEAEFIASRR
jgi:glycerol-3-phosphate dehydrogenase